MHCPANSKRPTHTVKFSKLKLRELEEIWKKSQKFFQTQLPPFHRISLPLTVIPAMADEIAQLKAQLAAVTAERDAVRSKILLVYPKSPFCASWHIQTLTGAWNVLFMSSSNCVARLHFYHNLTKALNSNCKNVLNLVRFSPQMKVYPMLAAVCLLLVG